ncbi:MAG: Pr6Pr family membrane protein [Sinobacteraceae bacterium]|nr:Pr6Pr family membrane protein [Nevskiaceae bacterium]
MSPGGARPRELVAILTVIAAWSGLSLQLYLSLGIASANGKTLADGVWAYLAYFTVLTNLLVALVLTLPRLFPDFAASRFLASPGVQAAAAAAILLVAFGYHLLLRELWNPQGLQWLADVLLHYVTPALFVLHWIIAAPKRQLALRHIPAWALYPLGYFLYALLRGQLTGLYPYPFLDVAALGLGHTLLNALGLVVGYAVIALGLLAVARLSRR